MALWTSVLHQNTPLTTVVVTTGASAVTLWGTATGGTDYGRCKVGPGLRATCSISTIDQGGLLKVLPISAFFTSWVGVMGKSMVPPPELRLY